MFFDLGWLHFILSLKHLVEIKLNDNENLSNIIGKWSLCSNIFWWLRYTLVLGLLLFRHNCWSVSVENMNLLKAIEISYHTCCFKRDNYIRVCAYFWHIPLDLKANITLPTSFWCQLQGATKLEMTAITNKIVQPLLLFLYIFWNTYVFII